MIDSGGFFVGFFLGLSGFFDELFLWFFITLAAFIGFVLLLALWPIILPLAVVLWHAWIIRKPFPPTAPPKKNASFWKRWREEHPDFDCLS